ncbi:MAG TPA: biosynthetic-type acetolactate synthase large subunit [bacterium]|nr:biosynthetic-type acetolactate synthase large subunit [bacterium]
MKLSGAQIVVKILKEEGVDVVFGYPGGVLIPLYDVLYDADIKHILPRHEQAGAHAADGYARASGKVGVCIGTSGPGATNLVTGIATAYMDSIPIVAITGQVQTSLIGGDAFQESDITGITRPITKHNYLVKDVQDLPRILKEAFHIARTGRPGPVLVDLPKDVSVATLDYDPQQFEEIKIKGYKPTYKGHFGQINRAVELINKSKKPIIYAGGGVILSSAAEELFKFAKIINAPVTTTLMGLGGFPETDDLSVGMLGMHGTYYANMSITESDLIIAIGTRFDDRVTGKIEEFAPNATIIHIDIDPAAISKNVRVDIPIVGDVKIVLTDMLKNLKQLEHKDWLKKIDEWKKFCPMQYKQDQNGPLKPQYIIEQISKVTNGNAVITTEVGQNQMWAAQFYKFTKPRNFISSGGLGTMGYGLPAAIGAKFARPNDVVIDIAGDGSIQMNIQELATLRTHNIPVIIALLNNNYLGMVRQWQELFFNRRYSATDLCKNPDFVKVANAYDIKAKKVTKPDEVENAIKEAIKSNEPYLLDFIIDREENVYPMVPAGAPICKMLTGGK